MTRPDFDDERRSHLANRYIRGKRIQTWRPVLIPAWFRRGNRADREQAVTEIICCREKVAALRLCGIEERSQFRVGVRQVAHSERIMPSFATTVPGSTAASSPIASILSSSWVGS